MECTKKVINEVILVNVVVEVLNLYATGKCTSFVKVLVPSKELIVYWVFQVIKESDL